MTGLFLFGMPVTGIIGGPLSGTIMSGMDGVGGWHGWQWVFVLEGLPTVLIGVLVYLVLANKPSEATWLSERERALVKRVLDADHRADAQPHHHGRLAAAFADPRTWVLAFIYFCCAAAVYTITFWLPTMIKGLGVASVATVGWYTAVPYLFGALGLIVISRSSDRFRERRWHVAGTLILGSATLYATTLLGGAFLPTMILLCVASFFTFGCALFWSIPPTYLSREAAATGIAVISSIGTLGGFVSPTLIGWIKTASGSINMGLAAMTALIVLGGLTLLFAVPASAVRVGPGAPDAAH